MTERSIHSTCHSFGPIESVTKVAHTRHQLTTSMLANGKTLRFLEHLPFGIQFLVDGSCDNTNAWILARNDIQGLP
jgi:hypothetical protein